MHIARLVPVAIALLIPVCGFAVDPTCSTARTATEGQKAACAVTVAFYKKHLATSLTEAQTKTTGRTDLGTGTNTVIQVDSTNVLRIREAADRTGRSSKSVTAWSCTATGAGTARTATCTGPTSLTVYVCAKTFEGSTKLYHLDTNSRGVCN
jgi:hypothetical protein